MRIFVINAESDRAYGLLKRKSEKDLIIVCFPWVSRFQTFINIKVQKFTRNLMNVFIGKVESM